MFGKELLSGFAKYCAVVDLGCKLRKSIANGLTDIVQPSSQLLKPVGTGFSSLRHLAEKTCRLSEIVICGLADQWVQGLREYLRAETIELHKHVQPIRHVDFLIFGLAIFRFENHYAIASN